MRSMVEGYFRKQRLTPPPPSVVPLPKQAWGGSMTTYTFQRGETVSLALDAVQGDVASVSSVTAALKPLSAGRTMVDPGAAVAATFSVSNRAAAGSIPSGWTLTIPAAVSAGLAAGTYLADAKLSVAGGVTITEPVAVRMIDAVTP
jgi:hypothetical protein